MIRRVSESVSTARWRGSSWLASLPETWMFSGKIRTPWPVCWSPWKRISTSWTISWILQVDASNSRDKRLSGFHIHSQSVTCMHACRFLHPSIYPFLPRHIPTYIDVHTGTSMHTSSCLPIHPYTSRSIHTQREAPFCSAFCLFFSPSRDLFHPSW